MNNLHLFLLSCLPVRLLLVYFAYLNIYNKTVSPIFTLIGLGLVCANYYGKSKGFFGSERYWPGHIHGLLYILFSLMLLFYPKHAWKILLFDIILGTVVVFKFYFIDSK